MYSSTWTSLLSLRVWRSYGQQSMYSNTWVRPPVIARMAELWAIIHVFKHLDKSPVIASMAELWATIHVFKHLGSSSCHCEYGGVMGNNPCIQALGQVSCHCEYGGSHTRQSMPLRVLAAFGEEIGR